MSYVLCSTSSCREYCIVTVVCSFVVDVVVVVDSVVCIGYEVELPFI